MSHLGSLKSVDEDDDDIPIVSLGMEETFLGKRRFLVGLVLAVSSTLFIGTSFIIKKVGLNRLSSKGQLRAGAGGYGYLKDWVWWAGFLFMASGELFNFAAYAFAPASLVTPLGALSILVTALMATKFLKEKLNLLTIIGCINCVFGSAVIVLHAPKEGQIKSLDQLNTMLAEPLFICYLLFVLIASSILIGLVAPKKGDKNVLVYISICSLIGSLSVMSCKGLGLALTETFSGINNALTRGLFWFLLISTIITIATQMNYLNKSLDIFDATIVTPVYYVFFTTCVLIASSILFQEWSNMKAEDIIGTLSGFFIVIAGVFMINIYKDTNPSSFHVHDSGRNLYNQSSPLLKSFGPSNSANGDSNTITRNSSSSNKHSSRKKKRGQLPKPRHDVEKFSSSDEIETKTNNTYYA
ncbi:magnesium transporter NIPA2 [Tetranychus urticae]|uniref:Magnesium transporter NIPA2 n=1 Tax=Tetranychus urticae TaxID=32264 RepID=T1KG99_TETUR|nr:magnesium transporter NIPA2 [Tetranychus urticae]